MRPSDIRRSQVSSCAAGHLSLVTPCQGDQVCKMQSHGDSFKPSNVQWCRWRSVVFRWGLIICDLIISGSCLRSLCPVWRSCVLQSTAKCVKLPFWHCLCQLATYSWDWSRLFGLMPGIHCAILVCPRWKSTSSLHIDVRCNLQSPGICTSKLTSYQSL